MQRRIAGFIVVVFTFTNILFAYQPEKNIWEERHHQIQLASLLPVPSSVFPSRPIVAVKPVLSRPSIAGLPAALQSHVRIADRFDGTSKHRVLILQDIHQNQEAQKHLSGVLTILAREGKQKEIVVGLEGAEGELPFERYHQFLDHNLSNAVAASFFENNELTGPVYTALTTHPKSGESHLGFYGVDDERLYSQNVEAYKTAHALQPSTFKQLKSARARLQKEKSAAYNPTLKTFDRHVQAYRFGELGLPDYLSLIVNGQSVSAPVQQFLEASRLEKEIDFHRVEVERTYVLEKLTRVLNRTEIEELVARSALVQNGEETHAAYFEFFKTVCLIHKIDLSKTPAFNEYVRYVLLSGKIQPETLFAELRRLEESAFAALTANEAERALIKYDRGLFLAERLVHFSLTPEEWKEYRAVKTGDLPSFEAFYELAEARNEKMVNNLLTASASVLVAGGFHTTGVTEILKKKGISFVVAIPKLTTVDTEQGSAYLSVFDREKTPLEQILSGRQLFLGEKPQQHFPAVVFNQIALSAAQGTLVATDRTLAEELLGVTMDSINVIKEKADGAIVTLKGNFGQLVAYIGSARPSLFARFLNKPAERARTIGKRVAFYSPRVPSVHAEQVEWGVDPQWLEENRSRIVPIFISGGEGPGVNDYFGYAARELRKQGLIPVAVQNGIQGFIGPGMEKRLVVIDKELEQRFLGMGGSLAGTSRVNLLKPEMEAQLGQALENMKGFRAYLAIGGGDHAVFWPKFASEIRAKEGVSHELKEAAAEILAKMIVVYKTIDGDTWGQSLGFYTAVRRAQEIIYGAAASSDAMGKITVVGMMGAEVGRLPVHAASKNPANFNYLETSPRSEDHALARQIATYKNQILTLIPEAPLSLQRVIDEARRIKTERGSVTLVVAEGFGVAEDDPLLVQLIDPESKYHDPDAAAAWQKALRAGRDVHGNIKRAEVPVELIITSALKQFVTPGKKESVRLAEKIGFGALRGANPTHYDRVYARLLAGRVAELVRGNHFGVVVSLPPDDPSIDEAFVRHFQRPALLEWVLRLFYFFSAEDQVFKELKRSAALRIHSFDEVYFRRQSDGLHSALHSHSSAQLRDAGVLADRKPYQVALKRLDGDRWQTTSDLLGTKTHSFKVVDASPNLPEQHRERFFDLYGKIHRRDSLKNILKTFAQSKGDQWRLLFDTETNALVGFYHLVTGAGLTPRLDMIVVDDGKRRLRYKGEFLPKGHLLRDLSQPGPSYQGSGAVDVLFEDIKQTVGKDDFIIQALIAREKVIKGDEPVGFVGPVDDLKKELGIQSTITKIENIPSLPARPQLTGWIIAVIVTAGAVYTGLISLQFLSYLTYGIGAAVLANELPVLETFLGQLEQEQVAPTTSGAEEMIFISDQHGAIDKFDALVLHALRSVPAGKIIRHSFRFLPDQPYETQLKAFGVSLHDFKGQIFFRNLGDLMDRGPSGIQVFEHAKELIDAGLSDFLVGNHCHWMFMNLIGFHLPWYDNFNFYNYEDGFDAKYGNVAKIVHAQHDLIVKTRTPSWWAKELAEYSLYQEQRQKDFWSQTVDLKVNGKIDERGKRIPGTGLYAEVSASLVDLPADSAERKLWDMLRGKNASDVDIYTGTRGVGMVSLKWWEDLLRDFKHVQAEVIQADGGYDFDHPLPSHLAWINAIRMMEKDIIPVLRSEIKSHLEAGEWWWRVFEAINYKNYTSPEWWAKDWVFHPGWGTSVLAELNRMRKEDEPEVTPKNYWSHPVLERVALFLKSHYRLYTRDQYQVTALHAFLPVDMQTGEFHFIYKGIKYRGKGGKDFPSVWEGLERIGRDVRETEDPFALYEAMSLVNSWYADNTTQAKPSHIAQALNKFGPKRLHEMNGTFYVPTGHIPFFEFHGLGEKRRGIISGFNVGGFIFTDHGMGAKFGNRGGYVKISPNGVQLFGYEHQDSSLIVENPRTVTTVKGVDSLAEEVLFDNPDVSREKFLPQVIAEVKKRIEFLREALPKGVRFDSSIGLTLFGFATHSHLLQWLGIAGMMLMAVVMVVMTTQPAPESDAFTEVQKHYPNLVGKNIFEVAMEMALTPEMFLKLEEKAREFEGQDQVAWHEIMQRVAMGESIGGIGPLLSERVMALTDLGAKVYGIAPLYDRVYFQRVKNGEFTIELLESGKYLRSILEDTKRTLHVKMYDGSVVHVKVWLDKEASLYYLDAPEIFTVAYEKKEESEERTRQNWLLSRGQLYFAKEFNIHPDITIQSETPTVYANPRLFGDELQNDPFFENTIRIYNDHTPVPYAHPHLLLKRVRELLLDPIYYLMFPSKVTQGTDGEWYVVPPETPLVEDGNGASVDMTKVLVIASDGAYAVSKEHRNVMQRMPVLRDVANLVTHITNGVLRQRWQAPEFANIDQLSDHELLAVKAEKKDKLLSFAQRVLEKDEGWKSRVAGLTVVRFMRRITGYKRFDLINDIVSDSVKLDEFLNSDTVLMLGGRVHQEDQWGKDMVNFLVWLLHASPNQLADGDKINLLARNDPARYDNIMSTLNRLAQDTVLLQKLRDRVLFFPNYNIYDAPIFVQGADATIMMADKGKEAAATGFQKDQMNGSIVLAVSEEGAIDESVYFSQEERLELLAATLSQDHSEKGRKYFADLAGNGFEIPSNGPNVENSGKYSGPTSRGLLDAINKLSNVRKGRTPLGTEGHPEIYPLMMRNAIKTTEQVSVERTGKDMLSLMSNLVRRNDNENNMYNLGVRQARYQHRRTPKLREQLLAARDGEPFTWTYLDGKTRHQPIYKHEGPWGHETGILNFIKGFQQVVRMGRLGRWSILYHTGDPGKNDLMRYAWHLVDNSWELKQSAEFMEALEVLDLRMNDIATSIQGLERTITGLQADFAIATDRTLVKGIQDKLTEAEDHLRTHQDALISQVYYLFGFLEGTVLPASALRKGVLDSIRDIVPAAAILPIIFAAVTDWKIALTLSVMIGASAALVVLAGYGIIHFIRQRENNPARDQLGYAQELGRKLAIYDAAEPTAQPGIFTGIEQQLAPVTILGLQHLGRLKQPGADRDNAFNDIFIRLTAKRTPKVKWAKQMKAGEVNLIVPGEISIEDLGKKLDALLKNLPEGTENKVLLTPALYAQVKGYERFSFFNVDDIGNIKELVSKSGRSNLTPEHVNVLFENPEALPASLMAQLTELNDKDPEFQGKILLYYLQGGFARGWAKLIRLSEMVFVTREAQISA